MTEMPFGKKVDEMWGGFQKDVEAANLIGGVIWFTSLGGQAVEVPTPGGP
jgi:hypothetical protein